MSDTDPSTLDRYRLIAEVGRGGMAEVHLALSFGPNGFNKLVVVKRVRAHLAEEADVRTMFMDEARLAGRLSHTNVVQTLEVAEHDGRPYLVMEYLEGQPLAAVLSRSRKIGKPFDLASALLVVREALEGLQYVHDLKDFDGSPLRLVHRDISPQNLFVTYDGRIKILDFGIAKAAISEMETRAGMLKGKISYMAPEQALGEPVDARSDLYSIGAILWDIAAEQRLWKGMPEGQALYRTVEGDVPAPSSIRPGVDPELERICLRALTRDPDDRYQDAASFAEDIDALIASLGGRPSARDVGDTVAKLFDDVRRETEELVADRIARVTQQSPFVAPVPELAASGGWSHSGSLPILARSDSQPSASRISEPSGASADLSGEQPRMAPKAAFVTLAAVLLGAVGLFAAFHLGSSDDGEPANTVPSSQPVQHEPTAAVAAPPSTANSTSRNAKPSPLEITVEPKTASVFVDDKKQRGHPITVAFEAKGARHSVRIEAKGYRAKSFDVVEGVQTSMHVALAPERRGRTRARGVGVEEPAAPAPEASANATPPADEPAPAEPAAPVADGTPEPDTARDRIKSLDTSNPWGG